MTAFAIAVVFGLITAAILAAFSPQIAGLYLGGRSPRDAAVIALAALFLKAAAAFQVVDAIQVVGAQSLRGLKDARMPMLLAGGSYWLIGAPICIVLALGFHLQGLGIWIGFVVSLTAAAIAMFLRFWRLTSPRREGLASWSGSATLNGVRS